MILHANGNYSNKNEHGIHFGLYMWDRENSKMKLKDLGGGLERLHAQDITRLGKGDTLLQLGNCWAISKGPYQADRHRWHDIRTIVKKGATVWYWDNPSLPHLLYPGPHNPQGFKNWMRLVKNSITCDPDTQPRPGQTGSTRINLQLQQLSDGKINTWHDIVGERGDPTQNRSMRALICPSSPQVFQRYYGSNINTWINQKRTLLEKHGYKVEVRLKPGRKQRNRGDELWKELHSKQIGVAVSCHSVGSIESLLAGVPVIVDGINPSGSCATSWQEYSQTGVLHRPCVERVNQLVERQLHDCYHKREAYLGLARIG